MRRSALAATFATLFAACADGVAATPIVYRLCRAEVQSVEVHEGDDPFRVTVKLTERASRALAELTGMKVGQDLVVTAGKSELSRGRIQARIDSGRLVSRPLAEADARDLANALREHLPASPCGVAR